MPQNHGPHYVVQVGGGRTHQGANGQPQLQVRAQLDRRSSDTLGRKPCSKPNPPMSGTYGRLETLGRVRSLGLPAFQRVGCRGLGLSRWFLSPMRIPECERSSGGVPRDPASSNACSPSNRDIHHQPNDTAKRLCVLVHPGGRTDHHGHEGHQHETGPDDLAERHRYDSGPLCPSGPIPPLGRRGPVGMGMIRCHGPRVITTSDQHPCNRRCHNHQPVHDRSILPAFAIRLFRQPSISRSGDRLRMTSEPRLGNSMAHPPLSPGRRTPIGEYASSVIRRCSDGLPTVICRQWHRLHEPFERRDRNEGRHRDPHTKADMVVITRG